MKSRIIKILENIVGEDNNQLENVNSNVEEILYSILYGIEYTKKPKSRIEELLLAIKNDGTLPDIPILSTAEEALKAKILGDNSIHIHNYFEYLISRWLGMASGKGYKTVTGKSVTISDNDAPIIADYDITFTPLVQNGCFVDYSIITIMVNEVPFMIYAINDGIYTPVCSGRYDDASEKFYIDKKYYRFDRVDSETNDWFYSKKMKIDNYNPSERIVFNTPVYYKVISDPDGNTRIAIRSADITTIDEMNDFLVDNVVEMLVPLQTEIELYEAEVGVIELAVGEDNSIVCSDGASISIKYAIE